MSNLQTQAANRYILWNGEEKQYEMWRRKFMVNCRSRKVYEGFEIEEWECPKLETGKQYTDEKKKEIEEALETIKEMNDKSFEHLVNSIDHNKDKGTLALGYVFGARTPLFKDGSAKMALKRLDDRYDTKDIQDQEELQREYDTAELNNKNPSDFEQDLG